jgi:hypothetical protein
VIHAIAGWLHTPKIYLLEKPGEFRPRTSRDFYGSLGFAGAMARRWLPGWLIGIRPHPHGFNEVPDPA